MMADRMKFPKTIQEFVDGYSFKDDKEIYTNGSRLIPTFRVEQALEHYGQEIRNKAIDDMVLQCKKVRARGLITNWGKPFGIEFDKLDEIAQQLKEGGTDGSERADN